GHAQSIEAWAEGELAGGVYGLSLGGAFFGESMFSRARDASKICLIHLCARLWRGGFTMLDTQFVNDHLKQFGVYEITHEEYIEQLRAALDIDADFGLDGLSEDEILREYLGFRFS
ncbi:MAG: leucyl/phenylalanyl-tRNA--protein transferase, partial [Alphaproteobacteria bacterium]